MLIFLTMQHLLLISTYTLFLQRVFSLAQVKAFLVVFDGIFLMDCTQIQLSNYNCPTQLIISHRGSLLTFPGYFFARYDDALVKSNLLLRKTNKPVVSHDDNLMSISSVNRNISDSNYLQLSKYHFKNGEQIHLSNDVFERYSNDINSVVETKFHPKKLFYTMERELIVLIEKYRFEKNVISHTPIHSTLSTSCTKQQLS